MKAYIDHIEVIYTLYKRFRDTLPLQKIKIFDSGKSKKFVITPLHLPNNFRNRKSKKKFVIPYCMYQNLLDEKKTKSTNFQNNFGPLVIPHMQIPKVQKHEFCDASPSRIPSLTSNADLSLPGLLCIILESYVRFRRHNKDFKRNFAEAMHLDANFLRVLETFRTLPSRTRRCMFQ